MFNMKEWAAGVMTQPQRIAIPIMTHPGISLIGSTVRQAVTDGETHAKAICELNHSYPAAACTAIMDLTVEAEAFGAQILFSDDDVPTVNGRLFASADDIDQLQVPSVDKGRVPEYLKANALVAQAVTDRPVFAGCIGPFSLAGRLYDMTELMMGIYIDPDAMHRLLEKCTQFIHSYIKAMKDTGISGVIMAEPAAGLVSNDDCSQFSSVYIKRIIDELQDDNFMIVLHNCGNMGHCTQAMVETGAAALHFGNKVDMPTALEECPKDMLVMGNLDPVGIMKQASPDGVREATLSLLQSVAGHPNFVLSTGCDVPPDIPAENIKAFYQALDQYNATL